MNDTKWTWSTVLLIVACFGLTSAGCRAPIPPTTATVERVSLPSSDAYDRLWDTTCQTLLDMRFRLDRQDRVNGVITTHPETSAQGFELWRPQPQPAYYWAEANLNTIQRRATVQFLPTAQQGEYDLDVKVERWRYRLAARQIDNSAGAMRLYSANLPTASGLGEKPRESGYWILLGRDEPAEQVVLSQILKR